MLDTPLFGWLAFVFTVANQLLNALYRGFYRRFRLDYRLAKLLRVLPLNPVILATKQKDLPLAQSLIWQLDTVLQRLGYLSPGIAKKYILCPCSLALFDLQPFEPYWNLLTQEVFSNLTDCANFATTIAEITRVFRITQDFDSTELRLTKTLDTTELFLLNIAILSAAEVVVSVDVVEEYFAYALRYIYQTTYRSLDSFDYQLTRNFVEILQFVLPTIELRQRFVESIRDNIPQSKEAKNLTYDESQFILYRLQDLRRQYYV